MQVFNETKVFDVDKFHVLDNLPDVDHNFPNDAIAKRYPHLNNLAFPRLGSCQVKIILGTNAYEVFCLFGQRFGEVGEPLGWTMFGNACDNNICYTCATTVTKAIDHTTDCLAHDLADSCDQDFQDMNETPFSARFREDERALRIMKRTIK